MIIDIKTLINEILTHQKDGKVSMSIDDKGNISITPPRDLSGYPESLVEDIVSVVSLYTERFTKRDVDDKEEEALFTEDAVYWLMTTESLSNKTAKRLANFAFEKETVNFLTEKVVSAKRRNIFPGSMLGKDVFRM